MSKALFISENTLIENSVIGENVSYTQLRPTIVKVQEMHIQPAVGSALYAELVTQVIAGTLSANNTTLMQTYIQPAIIQWMYFELPMVLAFKFMNKGMDRRSSTESTAKPPNCSCTTTLPSRSDWSRNAWKHPTVRACFSPPRSQRQLGSVQVLSNAHRLTLATRSCLE